MHAYNQIKDQTLWQTLCNRSFFICWNIAWGTPLPHKHTTFLTITGRVNHHFLFGDDIFCQTSNFYIHFLIMYQLFPWQQEAISLTGGTTTLLTFIWCNNVQTVGNSIIFPGLKVFLLIHLALCAAVIVTTHVAWEYHSHIVLFYLCIQGLVRSFTTHRSDLTFFPARSLPRMK